MLSTFANWSSIAGIMIGIAGLVFSILAFWAAKNAEQSADDARRDVRTLVAADRFQYLRLRARELSTQIENDNFPVAAFVAADLQSEITSSITRWEFLDSDTREGFKKASLLATQVLQVYELARRQALKVDEKLDTALTLLDKA